MLLMSVTVPSSLPMLKNLGTERLLLNNAQVATEGSYRTATLCCSKEFYFYSFTNNHFLYYQLNAAGNTFEQQSGGGTVAPFRCYLALFSNSLSVPKFFSIGNEDGTVTDISNISADTDGLRIYVRNGNILIESPTARSVSIYSIDGRLVRMVQLEGGVNTVSGLTRGFYIVERQKVVLK